MLSSLRGKLIFIFVALTVSVVIISSGYARYKQRQFALDRAKERALVDLELMESDIQSVLQWVMRDLLVLRDMPSLQKFLNASSMQQRHMALRDLGEEFLALARNHSIFQQVRFLDNRGFEVIRVNVKGRKTWLTPPDQLQDKSGRYYFREAIHLPPGKVYISPMDLNVENGQIERPIVPVIRYATPVVDRRGQKRGVLVLNVFGSVFLDLLTAQQNTAPRGEQYFLLNKDGYFLFHPDRSKIFGFMLGTNETLFRYEPELEQWIAGNTSGLTIRKSRETYKQTLYAFKRINLATTINSVAHANHDSLGGIYPGRNERYWVLLTTVDDANLLMGFNEYVQSFMPFTILLIVICVVMAVLVAWNCSRPIESLAWAAGRIQRGDLSARAQVYTSDDMGRFGKLFNEMAAKLEQTIRKLRLSETKYRQIFENSRDCIFVTDTMCNIVDINEAGRSLLGIDRQGPTGQLTLGCCQSHPDKLERQPAILDAIRDKGYVKNYETWLVRADGTTRLCLMTATARYDEAGNLIGYEGILRDVTEEKKRQEEKLHFHKKLQEEIVLAEERERRYIGQILHEEMAQNLALVNLKLQETEQQIRHQPWDAGDRGISKLLGEIREVINLMIRQIRTMIFDLYPTVLDTQGLVPAMLWYADNFTRRTGINVSVYGPPGDLGLSESQKIYLFRSFKELLHNAWKHAETKEIVATLQKKDNHVRLTVDDEGRGFDPSSLKSAEPELQGIGLLSIREWITAMGGSFSVESEPGKGTRISIDIPLGEDIIST
ncbi:PAS domain S-box protein [Desulfolithobacter sp.]